LIVSPAASNSSIVSTFTPRAKHSHGAAILFRGEKTPEHTAVGAAGSTVAQLYSDKTVRVQGLQHRLDKMNLLCSAATKEEFA
jgi:hypothetical protein